jgi:hypothetical protein
VQDGLAGGSGAWALGGVETAVMFSSREGGECPFMRAGQSGVSRLRGGGMSASSQFVGPRASVGVDPFR